jgi:hypothetical protein
VSRVNKVVGFGSVAVAVLIMFLPVSTDRFGMHENCGSAWRALFASSDNFYCGWSCGAAAVPRLLIAGAIAALGVGIASRGAGRFWALTMVGSVILITLLILSASYLHVPTDCGG